MDELIINVPDDDDILENGKVRLKEVVVKHQGNWKINLSDADPWPSNPHGDRIDEPEKLNLLNGTVYSKTNRTEIRKLTKKTMNYIYNKIKQFTDQRIFIKLNAQSTNITYL